VGKTKKLAKKSRRAGFSENRKDFVDAGVGKRFSHVTLNLRSDNIPVKKAMRTHPPPPPQNQSVAGPVALGGFSDGGRGNHVMNSPDAG